MIGDGIMTRPEWCEEPVRAGNTWIVAKSACGAPGLDFKVTSFSLSGCRVTDSYNDANCRSWYDDVRRP